MSGEDPAFPTFDKTTSGLTKREWLAGQILSGYLSAGVQMIPPLKEIVELADKLLAKCAAQGKPHE